MGAIWRMSLQTHYERDAAKSGKVVAAKWREIWKEVQAVTCCGKNESDRNIELSAKMVQNFVLALSWRQIWIDNSSTVSLAYYEIPDTYSTDAGDAGDEIAQREQALCLALQGWVHEVMNYMQSWMLANFEEALLGVSAGVATAAALTGLAYWPIIAMVSIPGALAVTIFLELSRTEYRDYIICRMFDNLAGQDPDTRADWDAALDADPNPRPEPQTIAQDVARDLIETYLRSQINNLDNYLMFAGQLGTAMDIARAGAIECKCAGEFEHEFMGGYGLQSLDVILFPGKCTATYDAVGDLVDGCCSDSPDGALWSLIDLQFESTVITRIRLRVNYKSTRATAGDHIRIWEDEMDTGTQRAGIGVSGEDSIILDTGVISQAMTQIQFEAVIGIANSACPDDSGGYSEIYSITINGEGSDPF